MRLYKGASDGSHWFRNDPRTGHGFASTPGIQDVHAIVSHITSYSHPSPFLSFTASPAVARSYALPAGGTRGRIYVIETTTLAAELVDPAAEITRGYGSLTKHTGHLWPTHHDGDQELLGALAAGRAPPSPVPHLRNTTRVPVFQPSLQALVYALRDAEVLVSGNIASSCVVDSWDVP